MYRSLPSLCAAFALALCLAASTNHQLRAQQGDKPKEDEKKWDVSAPLGPTTRVQFDTTDGTWMNVDVSPDGPRVVFDLLGDLYTLPIASAGESVATRLTSGPPFDMQPRFSPDGKSIAFISDRDGMANIW